MKEFDLWKETRTGALRLREHGQTKGEENLQAMSAMIEEIIQKAQRVMKDGASIFAGSSWVELLELWSSVGRRVSTSCTP
jgi:hypothetical protein